MAENESQSQTNVKGGGKTKTVIVIVIIAVLAATVGVMAMKLTQNSQPEQEEDDGKRQVVVNEDNAEEFVGDLLKEDEEAQGVPGSFDMVMNTTWHFADGKSESSDAYVENAKENVTPMYFDVRLTDTQETIYESPVLSLGTHVDKIKLMKDLDPGTYDCELTYHLVDDDQNTLGTVDVVLTIVVEN